MLNFELFRAVRGFVWFQIAAKIGDLRRGTKSDRKWVEKRKQKGSLESSKFDRNILSQYAVIFLVYPILVYPSLHQGGREAERVEAYPLFEVIMRPLA